MESIGEVPWTLRIEPGSEEDAELDRQIIRDIKAGESARRKRFDEFEAKHKDKLGNGKEGWEIYEAYFSYCEDSGSEEAQNEFRERFVKYLDRKFTGAMLLEAYAGALEREIEGRLDPINIKERLKIKRLEREAKKKWWQVWK